MDVKKLAEQIALNMAREGITRNAQRDSVEVSILPLLERAREEWTDEALKSVWTCRVRAAGLTDPPQDCDWPFCGCDPHARKVLEAIEESGLTVVRAPVPQEEKRDA